MYFTKIYELKQPSTLAVALELNVQYVGFQMHFIGTVRHAPISAWPCLSEANIGSCFETDLKIQNEFFDKKTNGFNSKDIINTGQNAYTT